VQILGGKRVPRIVAVGHDGIGRRRRQGAGQQPNSWERISTEKDLPLMDEFIVGGLILISACVAAHFMATRKSRRSRAWVLFTFFFPPLLLLLWFLPSRTPLPSVVPCPACSAPVSSAAGACPHCGHPISKLKRRIRGRVVEAIGIAALVVPVAAAVFYDVEFEKPSGLPRCDSTIATNSVDGALANIHSVKVIQYQDIRTVESNKDIVRCHASVLLGNNTTRQINFSFYEQNGEVLVKTKIEMSPP
jgi:predicted nucleic acid-binding Zn ribbon protein